MKPFICMFLYERPGDTMGNLYFIDEETGAVTQSWAPVEKCLATCLMSLLSCLSSRAGKEPRLLAPVCVFTFTSMGSRLWKGSHAGLAA